MKIYLAGPDVFFPDALAHGKALQQLCREFGFEGCFPLDPEAGAASPDKDLPTARRIYEANLDLIRGADAVMANVMDFRGHEPDSGTAFEIGFATALGLPVWLYNVPALPIVQQIPGGADGRDADGFLIEDFGMPRNLMLMCAARAITGDARGCLQAMHDHLRGD